jgi:hypothetical protein
MSIAGDMTKLEDAEMESDDDEHFPDAQVVEDEEVFSNF